LILVVNFAGKDREIPPLECNMIGMTPNYVEEATYAIGFTSKMQWSALKLLENLEENCNERMDVLSGILGRLNCFTEVGI
jgi:hypothetical protein